MKLIEKIVLFFIVIALISFASYNFVLTQRTTQFLYDHNKLCGTITDSLKDQINENSTCTDYYCYYAPYAPPSNLSNLTTTLCVCDCKLVNGTVVAVQILSTIPSTSLSTDFLKAK